MKTALRLVRIGSCGLGAMLAGIVLAACFFAYGDPGLVLALTTASFLCQ